MAKLMLVEDDNNLREIYEARLQAEGYTIVSAKDGEEALVVAKAEKPDLVISDVMMPKISGFEMLDILRNTDGLKDVKVIMLTALGQSDDQQRADRLGADRYLVKSQVTLEDIVKVAHELLGDDTAATPAPEPTPAAPAATATTPAPATDSPAPEPVAVAPEPVTEPPVAPAPEPAAVAPEPVATSDPVPAPTAAPAPEPVAAPATTDDSTGDAESTAQEEAEVEARIEDFVAGATEEATPVVAAPALAPSPEPVAATPEPTPGAAEPETPTANQTADDALVAQAVESLAAATLVADKAPEPAPSPTPETKPAAPAKASEELPTNQIAGKKVIEPLNEPKKDLDALLAIETANEVKTQAPTAPQPVIVTDKEGPVPPVLPPAKPKPATTTVAPTDVGAAPPATVHNPDAIPTKPAAPGGVDPNSIAL